jgi:sialidase-1
MICKLRMNAAASSSPSISGLTFKTVFLFSVSLFLTINSLFAQNVQSTFLWQNGSGAYVNYRIPSLIVTAEGTVLAICEGREAGDTGDIDILIKRSSDNGASWSDEKIIWSDEKNTCGNPCPVIDQTTGRIWLFLTWNLGTDHESKIINKTSTDARKPYVCYSDDDGLTWSTPEDLSKTCKDPAWGWYATGPGVGIQLTSERYKGRLVIPANHSYDDPNGTLRDGPFSYGSHVLISDDFGKAWRKSASITPGCNESQVVELEDGTLLMNMRSYNDQFSRAIATSADGGKTWSNIHHDQQLVESKCQASLIYFGKYEDCDLFLFSNPAVAKGRTHMTIKASFDNCKSWSNAKLINEGSSMYSSMAKLCDGQLGIFYEHGDGDNFEQLKFIKFPVETLLEAGAFDQ